MVCSRPFACQVVLSISRVVISPTDMSSCLPRAKGVGVFGGDTGMKKSEIPTQASSYRQSYKGHRTLKILSIPITQTLFQHIAKS